MNQVGHLGKDRTLELLRDRVYWHGMQTDVLSYMNSCLRCLQRKASKGNIENVTDHFTGYTQTFPSKTQTAIATAKLL